jgi:hypothetical protein
MYVKIVDPKCIDFVNFKDNGSIVAKECRFISYRCLLGKLEGEILYDMFKLSILEIYHMFISTLYNAKSTTF